MIASRLFIPVVAAISLCPATVVAQTIRGTVIEEGTAVPVNAAIVMLLDSGSRRIRAAFTDDAGMFTLKAPVPGVYRVLIERIGMRSLLSPAVSLRTGDVREEEFAVAAAPATLNAVRVTGRPSCDVRPQEGRQSAVLWDAVRKALMATAISQEERLFAVELTRFERELDPRTLLVRSERRWHESGMTEDPFVSLPAEELARKGWAHAEADGDDIWYYAPDAHVLLSDAFLDGHCFTVREAPEDRPALIGLGFEPAGKPERTDIEGVLWLDRASSELRSLEYSYVNPPVDVHAENLGGVVDFKRLASGHWIVWRWAIRMPHVQVETQRFARFDGRGDEERTSEQLASIAEHGGEVTGVRGRNAAWERVGAASLVGSVFDSTLGAPLAGATVFISGTQHSTITGSDGAFRLGGLPPGEYSVSFAHPRLAALGVVGSSVNVTLERSREDVVTLAVPSYAKVTMELCPDSLIGNARGVVRGVLRDARTGAPVAFSGIRVSWAEPTLRGGQHGRLEPFVEVESDANGYYTVCGIPIGRGVEVRVGPGRPVQLHFADVPVLTHELLLSAGPTGDDSAAGSTAMVPRITLSEGPLASGSRDMGYAHLVGRVRGSDAQPVADAQVRIAETGALALTDSTAAFAFTQLPAGEYTVAIRALGYRSEEIALVLRSGVRMRLDATLEIVPGLLAATQVSAGADPSDVTGFEERRKRSAGRFITRQDIDRTGAMSVTDILRRVPGVRTTVVNGPMGAARVLVQIDRTPTGAVQCHPTYYVDGNEFTDAHDRIDLALRAEEIDSIEVYRSTQAPARFPVRGGCGVVVIWTRRRAG